MDLHPHLLEYRARVQCDGTIYILKKGGGIVKKKPPGRTTVDLRYVARDDVFVDNDNIIYRKSSPDAAAAVSEIR